MTKYIFVAVGLVALGSLVTKYYYPAEVDHPAAGYHKLMHQTRLTPTAQWTKTTHTETPCIELDFTAVPNCVVSSVHLVNTPFVMSDVVDTSSIPSEGAWTVINQYQYYTTESGSPKLIPVTVESWDGPQSFTLKRGSVLTVSTYTHNGGKSWAPTSFSIK